MSQPMNPTLSLDEAAAQAWDAIVVGAGPAGAMAALLLARRGRRVLLVERSTFPRDKACGCCLNAAGADVLRRAGLDDVVDSAPRLDQLVLRRHRTEIRLALPGSFCVPREVLDTRIVERAIASGVQFIPSCNARLAKVGPTPSSAFPTCPHAADGVGSTSCNCPEGSAQRHLHLQHDGRQSIAAAALILACDGIRGSLLDDETPCRWKIAGDGWMGAAITLNTPLPSVPPGIIAMHVARDGYVGAVRLADGRTHLAAALDPAACKRAGGPGTLMRAILQSSGLADLPDMDAARVLATPLLTRGRRLLGGNRVIAVGDACGYVEPFTGEGMAWALQSAEALVAMLPESLADWPADLPRRWTGRHRRLLGTQQAICRVVRYCLHRGTMAAIAFAIARRLPGLGRAVARMIGRHNPAPQIGVAS